MRLLFCSVGFILIIKLSVGQPIDASAPTQKNLNSLRVHINQLKQEIQKTEQNQAQEITALQNADRTIAKANNLLVALQKKHINSQRQLDKISIEMHQARAHIAVNQAKIADLLRARYQSGNSAPWQLILNQRSPEKVSRDLQYYTYVAQAQQKLVNKLRNQLSHLDQIADQIQKKQDELKNIYQQQQQQHSVLQAEKKYRAALLHTLSKQVINKKNQLQRMQIDEKNLTNLINRLSRINTKKPLPIRHKPILSTTGQQNQMNKSTLSAPPSKSLPKVPSDAFIQLKGRLRLPVNGNIIGHFGQSRPGGILWKGIFIRTPQSEVVKAVAGGKIVFAEWLRGFGNMIIIDHGDGYMSLYGYNALLIKRSGELVKAGEAVARSGTYSEDNHSESGVYFEIRHYGKPQNPLEWAAGA